MYTVSQKKHTNFETVWLKIIKIDFDKIWKKYSKYSRIEFACFSFCVALLFLSTFCLSNQTPKIKRILTLYQANAPTLTSAIFKIKHTPKLIIFGTHNLQTFKHNTLINKVKLLLQFYLFNIRPKLHHQKLRKLCMTLFLSLIHI